MEKDTYKTIDASYKDAIFKDRGSKFLGFAYPLTSEKQVKPIIDQLKKQHHNARHWCYAYKIGLSNPNYRTNDDGEPNNSAGKPIYGQILSFDLTDILVVVVRYFGGTKLGVGGLIAAYKSAAKIALENATIVKKTIDLHIEMNFAYAQMNSIMRIIKTNPCTIVSQKMELDCTITIAVQKSKVDAVINQIKNLKEIVVQIIKPEH